MLTRTPSAVPGALVVYAAVRAVDLAGFRRLASFRRRELMLALGCLAGVLTLGILYGVLVAVGLSVAELLTRVARPHDSRPARLPLPARRDVVFARARVKQHLREDLDTCGLTESVGTERIFPTLPTALAAYRHWAESQ